MQNDLYRCLPRHDRFHSNSNFGEFTVEWGMESSNGWIQSQTQKQTKQEEGDTKDKGTRRKGR